MHTVGVHPIAQPGWTPHQALPDSHASGGWADGSTVGAGLIVLDELQMLREWYTTSFRELRAFHFSKPNPRPEDEPRFHELLDRIFERHIDVPKQMALACSGLRRSAVKEIVV